MAKPNKNKKNSKLPTPAAGEPIIIIDEIVPQRLNKYENESEDAFSDIQLFGPLLQEFFDEELFEKLSLQDEEFQLYETKIAQILGRSDLEVDPQNLKAYWHYLKEKIQLPCQLESSEEFAWEEYYLYEGGSKKKYQELKKTRPSHTDKFELINFDEQTDDLDNGIFVNVQRLSDRTSFKLPLWELEASDEKSPNYELLTEYVVWFVNYV